MVSEQCYKFSTWYESMNYLGARFCREYLNILMKIFQKKIAYLDSLRKNTQIEKKNWSNRSSDEGDIIDLKSSLLLENFVMMGQLQCARAKNLHALRYKMHAKL